MKSDKEIKKIIPASHWLTLNAPQRGSARGPEEARVKSKKNLIRL